MKRLFKLISILSLGIVIWLASCSNNDTLPNIEGHFDFTAYKTTITIKTKFIDTESHDLYYDAVRTYVTVSSTDEDDKELQRKDVSVIKPAITYPDDDGTEEEGTHKGDPYIERNLSGTSLDFSGLVADTTYKVKLIISANGVQKTLETKDVTTISNGESADDPIIINDLEGLLGMSKERTAYYKLNADIDCGGTTPIIFSSSTIFTGQFDGNGHTISNISLTGNNYSGLFGYMQGATVKDLNITDISYNYTRTDTYLGALAGYAERCTITNVNVSNVTFSHGGQTTRSAWIGSLVGMAKNSTIQNCYAKNVELTVTRCQLKIYIGGFIGHNDNSLISNCGVVGNINVTMAYPSNENGCLYLGGFAGVNDSNRGITSCYSRVNLGVAEPDSVTSSGYLTHHTYVGGFVGGNIHSASYINDCAAIGDIDLRLYYPYDVFAGGFVGALSEYSSSRLINCVYVPLETGLEIVLYEKPADAADDPSEEEPEETDSQEAWISLTVGRCGVKAILENVFTYRDIIEIVHYHDQVTVADYVVSQNIASFSQTIQAIIIESLGQ